MLEELKNQVYEANMELQRQKLVVLTWGNVSGIDRNENLFVIKPSGVKYEELTPEKMVVVDLENNVVEGEFRPLLIRKPILFFIEILPILEACVILIGLMLQHGRKRKNPFHVLARLMRIIYQLKFLSQM